MENLSNITFVESNSLEDILKKLENMKNSVNNYKKWESYKNWESWTLEEKKQLLELYLSISNNEQYIFELIYNHHGCDSWEDIFRDYDINYLKDKAVGVEIAIESITEELHEQSENKNN